MSDSPLSRFAAPIAIVAGVLVIVTRLVVALTVPTDSGLEAYVLTATHAINSVASIVAYALLVLASSRRMTAKRALLARWASSHSARRSSARYSWQGTGGTRRSRCRGPRRSPLK